MVRRSPALAPAGYTLKPGERPWKNFVPHERADGLLEVRRAGPDGNHPGRWPSKEPRTDAVWHISRPIDSHEVRGLRRAHPGCLDAKDQSDGPNPEIGGLQRRADILLSDRVSESPGQLVFRPVVPGLVHASEANAYDLRRRLS